MESNGIMEMDLGEDSISSLVPPEIWVKIFTMSSKSRDLSKLRLVCKQWQGVIDENFDMKVRINDDQMDVKSIINFKRVVQCIVSKFIRENTSPLNLIFFDPDMISSLTLRGTITKSNFLLIAEQCQNVKELSLTGSLLIGESNIFEVETNEERNILSNFMSGLQKLVVSGLHLGTSESLPVPVNLYSLLNWQMYQLKTLVIRVNFQVGTSVTNFFQLLKNFRSLEFIEFTIRSVKVPLEVGPTPFALPSLSTLNVEVRIPDRVPDWLPFIGTQSSIKHLKLITSYGEYDLNRSVVDAISHNSKSLQTLEMRKLRKIDDNACTQLFRELCKLKNLSLEGNKQTYLENLGLLTDSLEILVLEGFKCRQREITLIANRGVNLTTRNLIL